MNERMTYRIASNAYVARVSNAIKFVISLKALI